MTTLDIRVTTEHFALDYYDDDEEDCSPWGVYCYCGWQNKGGRLADSINAFAEHLEEQFTKSPPNPSEKEQHNGK